ncbi:MAG: glycogen debranching protein, partial [Actinomycetota bacterium]|nr:glycogen debranching protein [Actinomycetota bacterium]
MVRPTCAWAPGAHVLRLEDGRFYANGWHISGEMGGVWAPPLKLADGVWFGVGDQWVGQATKFYSGQGYTRYDLPAASGLQLSRTDFTPDGSRAALFGLTLENPGASDVTVPVKVDAHSELMTAYPWGFDGVTPNASDNAADHGAYADGTLQFTDDGTLPGADQHHYAALVAADQPADSGIADDIHGVYRGPQDSHVCQNGDQSLPKVCDDGPFGNGTGGQLRYTVTVAAGKSKTLWVAVAGSDQGLADAQSQLSSALDDPAAQLAAKQAS